jgi:Uma2 family endonuclease
MSQPATDFSIPPLEPGDHLTVAEFERRYHLHPKIKKAELIEGIVYMPSPVRYAQHGRPHSDLLTWLGVYRAATPGVVSADNTTLRLDEKNEVQPDALLRIETELGGRSHITEDDYLAGSPELIAEVAASGAAYDLHKKRQLYARNGVQEYLAIQVYEKRIDWFCLTKNGYQPLLPNEQGVLASQVFPGLWLLPSAFWDDLKMLLNVVQQGIASQAHGAFVATLLK